MQGYLRYLTTHISFWFCFFSLPVFSFGQGTIAMMQNALLKLPDDTAKVRILISLSETMREGNIAQSVQYALAGLKVAQKAKSPYWQIKSLVQLGWATGMRGDYEVANEHLNIADSICEKSDIPELMAEVLLAKGRVSYESQFLPEAFKFYIEALKLFETRGDSTGIANTCANMGSLYYFKGDYQQATHYLKRAEKIAREQKNNALLGTILSNQSNIYGVKARFDTSNLLLLESIELNKAMENYGGLAKAYTNMAMNYYDQQKYDSALTLFSLAYVNDSLWQNPVGILYSSINMAAAYRKLNFPQKALQLALDALGGARSINERHLQRTILEDIAEIYADIGQPQKALEYYRQFMVMKDTLLNVENSRIVADMQARYEVEKREKSYELLKAKQRQQNTLLYGLVGLAALLGVVGLLQYRLNKQKIKEAAMQVQFQEQQLASVANSMIQKDDLIQEISAELASLKDDNNQQRLEHLQELINGRVSTNDDWMIFQQKFEQIYPGFFAGLALRFPNLSPTETKICALEKLGLKDSQAGDMLGVNPESIRKGRYRLRKNMDEAEWEALRQFLITG
jgi:tetratricopeptide (TPR) repeat protein